ncbi:MAG: hypothetical protein C4523_15575 [Myxococcales bacterium]|nr:MAG: hypothetical protein C4523_15575 [Myxococcales bacterium]
MRGKSFWRSLSLASALLIAALAPSLAVAELAPNIDTSLSPVELYRLEHCENPRADMAVRSPWHKAGFAFWAVGGALALVAAGFGLASAVRLPCARRIGEMALLLPALTLPWLAPGRYFPSAQAIARTLGDWLAPSSAMPPEGLYEALWIQLFRLIEPTDLALFVIARSAATLVLVFIFIIAALTWRDRRAGLTAAVIAGGGGLFLSHAASTAFLTLPLTLLTAAWATLLMASRPRAYYAWPLAALLTASVVFAAPALVAPVILLALGVGLSVERRQERAGVLGLALIGLAAGLFLRSKLLSASGADWQWGWSWTTGWPPLLALAALIAGLAFGVKERRLPALLALPAALLALFLAPRIPAAFAASGAWPLVAVVLVSPLAGGGLWRTAAEIGRWTPLIVILWLGLLIGPALYEARRHPASVEEQLLAFQRESLARLRETGGVLYRVENGQQPGSFFADSLAGHRDRLCLRDRETVGQDPPQLGQTWIYFGLECRQDKKEGKPTPDECRWYRKLFAFEETYSLPIAMPRPADSPPQVQTVIFARVAGVASAPSPPAKEEPPANP